MSFEFIAGISGFLLTLIGAAFVGSRLNEGRHRKIEVKNQKANVLDLTKMLEKHDRITTDEREAIDNIPNVGNADIDRVLHDWPEVSGIYTDTEKAKSKDNKLK